MYACLWKVCSSSLFLLRCSSNKMYLMSGSSLINISYGNRCEAKKSSGRGQQQACSAGTPSRPPFSPSLGASPELGKKNKHRSPDVRLESPGACVIPVQFNSSFTLYGTFTIKCQLSRLTGALKILHITGMPEN